MNNCLKYCPYLGTHGRCVAAGQFIEDMKHCPTVRIDPNEVRSHLGQYTKADKVPKSAVIAGGGK